MSNELLVCSKCLKSVGLRGEFSLWYHSDYSLMCKDGDVIPAYSQGKSYLKQCVKEGPNCDCQNVCKHKAAPVSPTEAPKGQEPPKCTCNHIPHYWNCHTVLLAAPQAESAGKPGAREWIINRGDFKPFDPDAAYAISGNGIVDLLESYTAKLRAELEQLRLERNAARENLINRRKHDDAHRQECNELAERAEAAESSVTRLTRERDEAKQALFDKYKNGEIVELLLARPRQLSELRDAKERAETAERERDELLQADVKRAQDITRLTLQRDGFERERDEAREALQQAKIDIGNLLAELSAHQENTGEKLE